MSKIILSGKEAKQKMLEGIDGLANIVKLTMGPAGRNILLNNVSTQKITKDGVSVAKDIKFDDPVVEAGARLVKEAAQKTCDDSGDSTTLTCVLTQNIIHNGLSAIEKYKVRPIELKRAIDGVCKIIIDNLDRIAIPCNSDKMMKQVALISANGDIEIADLVCTAMKQATKDGAVGIETSSSNESYVETVTGMRFERGMESPHFQNNEFAKTCEFDSPNIILYRGKLDNINEFVQILEPSINIGRPLVIMADDFSMDVINAFAINKVQNGFKLCAVRLPSFKEQRDAMVDDLSILLDCLPINTPQQPIEKFRPGIHLGSCDKIVIDRHYTTITGGDGDEANIRRRIEAIRDMIDRSDSKDEIARLRERLVKLSGGVSVIYVGSDSETETNEMKDRVDDAVCAVRSAMQEGVIPGGGATLLSLINFIPASIGDNSAEQIARSIMQHALYEPIIQLFKNAGYMEKEDYSRISKIVEEFKETKNIYGFDINNITDTPVDLLNLGIIDPKKSIRVAIENAVSVAGMFITTEACVVEDYRK